MRHFSKILIAVFITLSINSCNQVLDTEDQSAVDEVLLFNDDGLAVMYLNRLYLSVLPPRFDMLRNADLTTDGTGGGQYMTGMLLDPVEGTDDTPGAYNVTTFANIRNIILFINGVLDGNLEEVYKEELLGQAYFLRAYVYWDLVLYYGGVPIIDRILDVNDGAAGNSFPRSSAKECVDFIVADLDKSIELLSSKSMEFGRITASAAAALKGRVLMFYASPQFDPNGENSVDGISARWQEAYQANLEAKDIAEAAGHDLYPDYANIFINEDNEEAILFTKFTVGLRSHGYDNSVRPFSVANTYQGNGTPTWDFVKAFTMKDGSPATQGAGYDSAEYWVDRDPRFYNIVAYNGSEWKFSGRADDYQWTYQYNSQEGGRLPNTGFYLRKNVNTSIPKTESNAVGTDWIEIRFAEVLLNLAECANEVGETSIALDQLRRIRQRAGIEMGANDYGLTLNGTDKATLRALIMNERRIELCFENKRHFDLRRRNMFINGLSAVGNGINGSRRTGILTEVDTAYISTINPDLDTIPNGINKMVAAVGYFEANIQDTVDWSNPVNPGLYFKYSLEYKDNETSQINYLQPKYNFYYLPTNATVRNENLIQTRDWLDGDFDPLVE
ncbi:RagB/SusD family nutrient uptake outer membrane protein [Marinoscillum sp. MHG1-6]|uniref:RagB/SusD family nutrient uptake outer membrane protein n=1 Tax=Marinoscillum sp. MHG1-6 TaxID=2959627 RepID=UPI002158448F|nr:RagB/SusD family nutrient uptake outer membrane protein [Marinoscillum sp. MHG1-6]